MKHFFTIFILLMFFAASTSFAQLPWTKYANNPVLSPGSLGSWEEYDVHSPCVLKHGDTLKMWYSGSKSYDVAQIGYAISTDGINWLRHQENPVLRVGAPNTWDAKAVIHPRVILVDTTYHMWYGGTDDPSFYTYRMGYATSTNGINWTKYPGNPVMPLGDTGEWDSATGAGHSCFFDGDTFHVWYGGCDGPDWANETVEKP